MRSTKLHLNLCFTLGCVLFFVACQKKHEDNPEVNPGGRGGVSREAPPAQTTPTNSTAPYSGLPKTSFLTNQWGEVVVRNPTDSSLNLFQQGVEYLVSATMDPALLGRVSGRSQDSTGLRFRGYVETRADGTINLQNTRLRIVIWDDLVGQKAENGQLLSEIPISFNTAASATIQGNTVKLVFIDELPKDQQYGEIRLEGQFTQDYFVGDFSFTNYKNAVAGEAPHSGNPLGSFTIRTCGFLNCAP